MLWSVAVIVEPGKYMGWGSKGTFKILSDVLEAT